MSLINYPLFLATLKGRIVPRPNAASHGTLSGHAAGEPFEKLIYDLLKQSDPTRIYKQFEYLNALYQLYPTAISPQDRFALFNSPIALFLLSRSETATAAWTPENIFQEKQNDTADFLAHENGFFELVDVKTRNRIKHAQPPNIISSYKLAQMCALMFDNQRFDDIDLNYIEVEWEEQANNTLICTQAYHAYLFKVPPEKLYINWAAAMQIQFYVHSIEQTFNESRELWAKRYLYAFTQSAQSRCQTMYEKYVTPFQKYLF